MEKDFVITAITRVVMVGKEEYPEQSSSYPCNLSSNELIYNFSGRYITVFGDVNLMDAPNTIRFLPKGTTTKYEVHRIEHGECIDVCFEADRELSLTAFVLDVSKKAHIGNLFKKLFAKWVGREDGYYFECISLLYKIFAELNKNTYIPNKRYEKIEPAISLIMNSILSSNFSTANLAKECGMSETYFKRVFKERFGTSPKKYLIQRKINHASELLRLERYTVTQVAEMSGFSDVFYFSRQFKAYMGITPTDFLKKYKSSK